MIKKKYTKALLKEHDIRPKKKLGQNFIFDENILNKISKSVDPVQALSLVEIGPGPGGLTKSLLEKKPKSIILIEKDISFKKILLELTKDYPSVKSKIIFDDFLNINLKELDFFKKNKVKFISNLPYYISTQILLKILPFTPNVIDATFMFQKEVAERLLANPHNKKYSKLSVIVQYCCNIKKILHLKSSVFFPKPDVDSCLLNFTPKNNIKVDIFNELKILTKFAFEKRRKTIRNSLSKIKGINELLTKLKIDDQCRAENLSVEKYALLARNIVKKD